MSPIARLFPPPQQFPDVRALPLGCVSPAGEPFPAIANGYGVVQLLFLLFAYSVLVLKGSVLIASGGELLLLIPSIAPLVGSLVLPILGAVPDAAFVIFSGLGPQKTAQKKVALGIGALAGATVMLLTLPWFLLILAGRVDVDPQGQCCYSKRPKLSKESSQCSIWPRAKFWSTGVQPSRKVMRLARNALGITTIPYIVVQGAAFAYLHDTPIAEATHETAFIAASLGLCLCMFLGYLGIQVYGARLSEVLNNFIDEVRVRAVQRGEISLDAVFYDTLAAHVRSLPANPSESAVEAVRDSERLKRVVRQFFSKYDSDRDGSMDTDDLRLLLRDLHLPHSREDVTSLRQRLDFGNVGKITFDQFFMFITRLYRRGMLASHREFAHIPVESFTRRSADVNVGAHTSHELADPAQPEPHSIGTGSGQGVDDDDDDDDDVSMPDDLVELSPEQQRRIIVRRAVTSMLLGSALIILFSDPLIDILGQLADVMGISGFYVSFVFAPFASNAFEIIASYTFARRKSAKTVTISFATLMGAAILNNTLVLSVFLAIILARNLAWEFSAETIAIVVVELLMCIATMTGVHTMRRAVLVVCLWPGALALVAILENVVGIN